MMHAVVVGNEALPEAAQHRRERHELSQLDEDGGKVQRITKMRRELKKIFNEDLEEELNMR